MFSTIMKKEIIEAISSHRFVMAAFLCLILLPLGMYVNLKDYEKRLKDHQESLRLYQQQAEGNVSFDFQAEGYRPPSVFSIFSVGLEYFLPNKIATSRTGVVLTTNESGVNNPQSLLFGKVDLLFNVSIVISLLALIFTFSAITEEKETGTLRLLMSNPISRGQILLAKIVGNYVVLLVPFFLSLLVSITLLNILGIVPIFSSRFIVTFLIILFVTLLFILSMCNLGILVSTLTYRSITSIVTLLFIWTLLVLSFPKIGPMIAEIIYPVESQQVANLRKQLLRENLEQELDRKRRELFDKIITNYGLNPRRVTTHPETDAEREAYTFYDENKRGLDQEYQQRISAEIAKFDQDYNSRQNTQALIAMNLSRISPVSCYAYILSEISGTGVLEMDNFLENAHRFQSQVKETLYDKFIVQSYGGTSGATATRIQWAEGFDPNRASVPQLSYRGTILNEVIVVEWIDVLLLLLFNIVFFAISYVSFLRYDVR